jgi:transglutaminase-like putative cysteine protease
MGHFPTADSSYGDETIRVVTSRLVLVVVDPAEIVLQIVASGSAGEVIDQRLDVDVDGEPWPWSIGELPHDPHGASMQVTRPRVGRLTVAYRAKIRAPRPRQSSPDLAAGTDLTADQSFSYEQQVYMRPSRYCPSDHLVGFAVAEFGSGPEVGLRVAKITEWIRGRIGYLPGSSDVHDSAEDTLLTAVGSCRDFAHLGVALCRATGIPARFAAVYAPGLSPMDFHAVFEAFENGRWYVHDPTGLAPRSAMVRIATGRDAADTAFASVTRGIASLEGLEVSATTGGALPLDDHSVSIELN